MQNVGLSIVWFVVIVVAIPLTLWWLKRTPMGAALAGGVSQPVKPVATLALGPGQRIVTVEVGQGEARTWVVLGVTAHSIQTLHTLPPQTPPASETPEPLGFKALLGKLRQQEPK